MPTYMYTCSVFLLFKKTDFNTILACLEVKLGLSVVEVVEFLSLKLGGFLFLFHFFIAIFENMDCISKFINHQIEKYHHHLFLFCL